MTLAAALPADMVGPFLVIVRAALEKSPCPDDAAIAAVYGTSSLGRVRRLIGYMESTGLIVCRTDLAGNRSISVPQLGCTTLSAPADPAAAPPRARRRLAAG